MFLDFVRVLQDTFFFESSSCLFQSPCLYPNNQLMLVMSAKEGIRFVNWHTKYLA